MRVHTWFACLFVWFELNSSGAGTAVERLDWREQAEVTTASIILTTWSLDCKDTGKKR